LRGHAGLGVRQHVSINAEAPGFALRKACIKSDICAFDSPAEREIGTYSTDLKYPTRRSYAASN
jgi:hypothetical protein